jgi:hypothetical protein
MRAYFVPNYESEIMIRLRIVFALSAASLIAACETTSSVGAGSDPAAAPLGVSFSWDGTSKCFDPASPAFTISGAPSGTTALKFNMTDLDAPGFRHGGGTVTYTGASVPQGAFTYKGPCPPSGSHDYRWDVKAVDSSGTVLAKGSATQSFSQAGR